MDRWQYTMILAGCLIVTLPLELVLGARVYRRPARLMAALAPVVAVFVAWDAAAARRVDWWWSADLITGVRLLGVPLEEWLFFVVVPVCAVLTYEALGTRSARPHPAAAGSARSTPPAARPGAGRRMGTRRGA